MGIGSRLALRLFRNSSVQAVFLAMALVVMPVPALAGRNCEAAPPDAVKTQKGLRFASQVRDALERSDVRVALLARVGSDQSNRGVRFTHVGFVLREHPAGPWTVVHELNACGSGSSDLFDEGLGNFFMDDPFAYETKIFLPSPDVQDKLIGVLRGPQKRAMHESVYSAIANPWSVKYQNSNGWALELWAAAMADGAVHSRSDAQSWLKDHGYQPSRLHIGAGERAGARLFTPNVRFGDHPDTAWQTQTYEVSTGDSVMAFVGRVDAAARIIVQRLDAPSVVAPPRSVTPGVSVATTAPARAPARVAALVPAMPATPAATVSQTVADAGGVNRAQLLQSMQGLIKAYACRPQGYLSQCRQLERNTCEAQVNDAVLRCFATVSDQQLMSANEQGAMQQMQEIGYCAVEGVDASMAKSTKPAQGAQGQSCASVRGYK